MTVREIQDVIEHWAPREIAWGQDNVGLQIGNPASRLLGILIALDVTEKIITEARRHRANLIISHHPLLFKAPRSITPRNQVGRCIDALVKSGIALYSAHTNLDFAHGGTSWAIAEALGLTAVDFLYKPYKVQRKIVTFVPTDHVDRVAVAMAEAGAGRIGNYDNCSFRMLGTGTFKANERANPVVGSKNVLEKVAETRLEMVVDQWLVPGVLKALKQAHPYEEVAHDVYPTENESDAFGMGIIGMLVRPMTLKSLLALIKKKLGARALRCTGSLNHKVSRIAACGGSGSELLDEAVRARADAFITADVKYHTFHDANGRIALIDAGHYETEHLVVQTMAKKLAQEMRRMRIHVPVFASRTSTNPIVYV
ncbi:MAG: Nif3-like dinuclear metal center hexameric protein [Ignavibacteriae bacterium]|nr:Nif3-like dinuclear metal center hexameric protein [Ignavibacteriota bacterium]